MVEFLFFFYKLVSQKKLVMGFVRIIYYIRYMYMFEIVLAQSHYWLEFIEGDNL